MPSELSKLSALLNYTVKHNREHAEELESLAREAKQAGMSAAYTHLMRGLEQMNNANEHLEQALRSLAEQQR
jgi:hypothetical protein